MLHARCSSFWLHSAKELMGVEGLFRHAADSARAGLVSTACSTSCATQGTSAHAPVDSTMARSILL